MQEYTIVQIQGKRKQKNIFYTTNHYMAGSFFIAAKLKILDKDEVVAGLRLLLELTGTRERKKNDEEYTEV